MKISRQRQRDDEQQAMLGLLHLLELAAPFGAVGAVEQVGRLLLGLGDGAGQIAAAHAELDGDQALALLAVNRRGARPQELAVAGRARPSSLTGVTRSRRRRRGTLLMLLTRRVEDVARQRRHRAGWCRAD